MTTQDSGVSFVIGESACAQNDYVIYMYQGFRFCRDIDDRSIDRPLWLDVGQVTRHILDRTMVELL